MSRTTGNGPSGNQPDDGECIVCGGTADGIDARLLEPICEWCALLHLDADFDPDDVDRGDGVETDGGRIPEGQPIDPLVCPRGHHSVEVGASRFGCETCRSNDLEPARWDRSELVDLRTEEPPLADGSDERGRLVTDGGLLTGGSRYHVVCSDCTFEDLKRERHQAARAVDDHRTDEPSHDVRFEEVAGR
jgi:hypothetical protein